MKIPIVNLETKAISGAKPGTFEYKHEEAHLKFNESNFGQNIQYLGEISQYFTIIFLAVALFIPIFKYFAMVGVVIMLFSFVFEEIWCNYSAR